MTARHKAAEHHASAAFHHDQAARYHREAFRHFEVGKDYEHTAHKALVAHVHGLRATERGIEASRSYAGLSGIGLPWSPALVPDSGGKQIMPEETIEPAQSGTLHHLAAAEHHEQATHHHRLAAELVDADDLVGAAYETEIARDHARQAVFHDDEAAKHYLEHYGDAASSDHTA